MVHYYKVLNTNTGKIEYWRGDASKSSWLLNLNNLIIPLGQHLPKNVSRETLKHF